ncbi:MAG: ComEC/Rec2 family competence protein [Clostridia bacterium]|nr:ComEC/Rec2 family competence protein [Clostridia bacterium]
MQTVNIHDGLPDTFLRNWSVKRPLLLMGLTACAATVVGLQLSALWAWVLAGVLALCLLIPPLRRPKTALVLLTTVLCLINCGYYRHTRVAPIVALDGREDVLTGQTLSLPETGRMFTVEVTESSVLPIGCRIAVYSPNTAPAVGDYITTDVELSVPDYSTVHRADGVFIYAFPKNTDEEHVIVSPGESKPLTRLSNNLRRRLNRALSDGVSGEDRTIIAALCLGEKAAVSTETKSDFNGSGLSHLLVVSGLHLTLLAVALRGILRRLGCGYRLSAALTLLALPVFVLLVGATPSVLRAAIMCGVWLIGLMLCRRADGLNSLGLAAVILVLVNPYYLLSAGFQLSFAATAGVLCITPRLCRNMLRYDPDSGWLREVWRQIRNYIHSGSAVCVGAMLFTLPIACYYYGGFSLTFLPANLLAVAPAGWILVLGWLGMLCCLSPLTAWLGKPLLILASYLTRYLKFVARLCSPDGSYLPLPRLWGWLAVTVLCVIIVYFIRHPVHRRRFIATVTVLVILVVGTAIPITRQLTEMTVTRTSTGAVLTIRQQGRTAVITTDCGGLRVAGNQAVPPDAVFVGVGNPTHASRGAELIHDGTAIYTADNAYWMLGSKTLPTEIAVGDSVTLWAGAQVTVCGDGWYRVDVGATPVWLCGNPKSQPPETDGMVVYSGIPSHPAEGYGVIATSTTLLARYQPKISGGTLVLTEKNESVIFIAPTGGEWSVRPWQ